MLKKQLYKLLDLAWAYIEPKLKQLVQDEIVVITQAIDAEVESIPQKLIDKLTNLPTLGGFIGGLLK